MRKWIQLILALAAIALLLWLGYALFQDVFHVLGDADLSGGESDPMFAEEAVLPTRPPELDAEVVPPEHPTLDDYVPEVETPVDRTVEELIEEAQARNAAR
ncbi:MAG: hypothetical protein SPH82_10730 [Eubacteriales bacterium]|nr:hypothetical protein [Eubacteriales bacterium]